MAAYQISSLADWNALNSQPTTDGAVFTQNIAAGGVAVQWLDNAGMVVDMQGFEFTGITGYLDGATEVPHIVRDGAMINGRIDVNVTVNSGDLYVFQGAGADNDSLRITGSLTNTGTGKVGLLSRPQDNAPFRNCVSELVLTGNDVVAGWYTEFQQTSCVIENCIFIGELVDGGSGTSTLYGFTPITSSNNNIKNCFWDTEKTGVTNNGSNATGKTTAELQTIATYNDTATTGLETPVYSIEDVGAWLTETWKIKEGEYPILSFEEYPDTRPQVNVTFNSVAEPNTNVLLIQSDDKNWTNASIVDAGSTDANGDYVYTGVYDESKVFTFALNKPDSVDSTLAKGALRMANLNVI